MTVAAQPSFEISSFCHSGGCVAVALGADVVAVRSSQEADGPILSFGSGRWTAFVDGLRAEGTD